MELTGGLIHWFKYDLSTSLEQCPYHELGDAAALSKYIQLERKNLNQHHVPLVYGNDLLHLQDAVYRWSIPEQQYIHHELESIRSFKALIFQQPISVPVGNIQQHSDGSTYSDTLVQFKTNYPYPLLSKFITDTNEVMYVTSINGMVGISIPLYKGMDIIDISYGYYRKLDDLY
ncbi:MULTISPECIES: hypothetical protein [Bacillus cereus group]|uniref:hypothetical protein n=1 Tax=Bacillus cereus group TaxID=86661 RepID=UPI0018A75F61|nr:MULTISPECIES: hypothetical protein [Bacillus cereus group]MBF8118187.1 hypothetical protein [Bacillus cereus]MCC2357385.1 hypothetical protein [Bacillus paranthracis]MCC3686993.1 hypothetical protein [Bacillus cereus]